MKNTAECGVLRMVKNAGVLVNNYQKLKNEKNH